MIWFGDMPDCYHLGTDYFALGGYAMGMYLMRQAAGDGLPAFMSFYRGLSFLGFGAAVSTLFGHCA